ncbi:MAG: hypothetical protein K2G58_01485 [Alistipes sp.]|nr:hypothetical protein [Alistipes sp.]
MKKLKLIIFGVLMVLCASCDARKNNTQLVKEIEQEVQTMGEQCPISFGLGNDVVLRKISFEDNTLTYCYSVADIGDAMMDNAKNIKMSMLYMAKSDAAFTELCRKIIEVGGKVVYTYDSSTGKSISLEFSNQELKEFFD